MRTLIARGACYLMALLLAATFAHGQTFKVVYNFGTQATDPHCPDYPGIIAQGRDGNLYSSAILGGSAGYGATYRLTPAGVLSLVYSFQNGTDGAEPVSGLTLGKDGNLYGTTETSGAGSYGTVFKNTPEGGFTLMHYFRGGWDGGIPFVPPIQGTDGNFYGTSQEQGPNSTGAIYKITPSKSFTALYDCDLVHCSYPSGPLLEATDGDLYGGSIYGGNDDLGTIFKITPAGKLTTLYSFDDTHGNSPIGPMAQATDGNFYGTTWIGGRYGSGVVFKITPGGHLTVLHSMNLTTDGGYPTSGLVQATDGNLYGANISGGTTSTACPYGCGTLFKITTSGAFSVIHNFADTDGNAPYTTLMQHTNGLLYGTAQLGGAGSFCPANGCGVVYRINIGAAPFVTFVGQPAGKVGETVEILGQGLAGTTAVSFNGTAAKFRVPSDTYLTASVPSGATTGILTVTTPAGVLSSNKSFRVTH